MIVDSEEIVPGVIVDYDINDEIVGIEMLWVSDFIEIVGRGKS